MSLLVPADITAMGFVAESFGQDSAAFSAWLQDIIEEQESLLTARIGDTAFATGTPSTKRAAKCLVAAELLQLRFVRLSEDVGVTDKEDDVKRIRETRREYLAEADRLIAAVLAGSPVDASGGYSGSVSVSGSDSLLLGFQA
ncbi:MAG: hypothetical protein AB7I29_05990 [Geobacter sp.]